MRHVGTGSRLQCVNSPCTTYITVSVMVPLMRTPDSKVHGANMGSTSGRQDAGGPHKLCHLGSYLVPVIRDSWHLSNRVLLFILMHFGCYAIWRPNPTIEKLDVVMTYLWHIVATITTTFLTGHTRGCHLMSYHGTVNDPIWVADFQRSDSKFIDGNWLSMRDAHAGWNFIWQSRTIFFKLLVFREGQPSSDNHRNWSSLPKYVLHEVLNMICHIKIVVYLIRYRDKCKHGEAYSAHHWFMTYS